MAQRVIMTASAWIFYLIVWITLPISCTGLDTEKKIPVDHCNVLTPECYAAGGLCASSFEIIQGCDIVKDACPQGCTCCSDCSNDFDQNCRYNFGGTCKKTCDDTENSLPGCKEGCTCCGCPSSERCKAVGGNCVVEGLNSCPNGVSNPNLCEGQRCTCCVKETTCDVQTPDCDEVGGHCIDSGMTEECDHVKDACHEGCACCIECSKHHDQNCRYNFGGTCKKTCDDTENSLPGCKEGCTCCGCPSSERCKAVGGNCVVEGLNSCPNGVSNSNLCEGKRCTCCVKENS